VTTIRLIRAAGEERAASLVPGPPQRSGSNQCQRTEGTQVFRGIRTANILPMPRGAMVRCDPPKGRARDIASQLIVSTRELP